MQKNILIIGGGLAGLTAAIHLSGAGFKVLLIEKNGYPHHKVCGEYISNEVLPYLQWLHADPYLLHPVSISKLEFNTGNDKKYEAVLPLGGFGISRYAFDQFLYNIAIQNGCNIVQDQVSEVLFNDDTFTVKTSSGQIFDADVVLGAYGKRSNLDIKIDRPFIHQKSPWLAVKQHYKGKFNNELVGLYCFAGGYCGVSKVEGDIINVCYITDYTSFKKHKDIEAHKQHVLYKNPVLKKILQECTPLFERPITISQISFEQKNTIEDHILMIGDSAGLINPLCGNGMAMAIHSAKLAAENVIEYLNGNISRLQMEQQYTQQWNQHFKARIKMGQWIAHLFRKKYLSVVTNIAFKIWPGILNKIIAGTHGQPIKINAAHEYNIQK